MFTAAPLSCRAISAISRRHLGDISATSRRYLGGISRLCEEVASPHAHLRHVDAQILVPAQTVGRVRRGGPQRRCPQRRPRVTALRRGPQWRPRVTALRAVTLSPRAPALRAGLAVVVAACCCGLARRRDRLGRPRASRRAIERDPRRVHVALSPTYHNNTSHRHNRSHRHNNRSHRLRGVGGRRSARAARRTSRQRRTGGRTAAARTPGARAPSAGGTEVGQWHAAPTAGYGLSLGQPLPRGIMGSH